MGVNTLFLNFKTYASKKFKANQRIRKTGKVGLLL